MEIPKQISEKDLQKQKHLQRQVEEIEKVVKSSEHQGATGKTMNLTFVPISEDSLPDTLDMEDW